MKILACLLGTVLLAAAGGASAQLGNGGSAMSDVARTGSPAANMMSDYLDASRRVLGAEAASFEAIGLKDEAAQARKLAAELDGDVTIGTLEAAIKAHADLQKRLVGAFGAAKPAAGGQAGPAILELAAGARDIKKLTVDLADTKKKLRDTLPKSRNALYIAKVAPELAAEAKAVVHAAQAFAAANGVALAAEVAAIAAEL